MEKIGLTAARAAAPHAPGAAPGATAALLKSPGPFALTASGSARAGQRAVDPFPRSARPVFDDMFAFAMDGSDGGLMSIGDFGLGSRNAQVDAAAGANGSLSDYEALLDSGGVARQHDAQAGTPLFGTATPHRNGLEGAQDAETDQRLTRYEPTEETVEQFSISHPAWGLVEVDSRRSGRAWGVTVRCEESFTRDRLRSREPEFRDMLQRKFGVSLELDVQPVTRR